MKGATDIQNELSEMGSMLAGMPRTMPYAVPDGYFTDLPANITTLTSLNEDYQLTTGSKVMPYSGLPAGYFDQLPTAMLAMAQAADAATPAITLDQPAKTRTIAIRSMSLATAAVLLLTIGLGAYMYLYRQNTGSGTEQVLAAVPRTALHDYLQNNYMVDVDRVLDNDMLAHLQLDNKDIINYLDDTGWE